MTIVNAHFDTMDRRVERESNTATVFCGGEQFPLRPPVAHTVIAQYKLLPIDLLGAECCPSGHMAS